MGAVADDSVTEIRLPAMYPKQREALFGPERLRLCEAAIKAGKSVAALAWITWQAINVSPGRSHVWVSPVYPQARVMYRRMLRYWSRMDPARSIWSPHEAEMRIDLPGGGNVVFKGSDRPDSIYGSDYASAVVDEASRCKEEAFHAVESTTTATNGPIRCIGNVSGRTNWFWHLCRRAECSGGVIGYSRLTCWDAVEAGIVSRESIEAKRSILPESVFQELFEARASDDGGNPFGMRHIRAAISPMSSGPAVCYGVDLAKSTDWTVVVGLDAQGRVCVFDRWQGSWETTTGRVAGIVGNTKARVDSTGVGDPIVEMLSKVCPNIEGHKFSSQSKQDLMVGLAAAIQHGDVRYPEGVIVSELESFGYEVFAGGRVRYEATSGHDDCVCALALAYSCLTSTPQGPRYFFGSG